MNTSHEAVTDEAYSLVQKIDIDLHEAINLTEQGSYLQEALETLHGDVHDLAFALKNSGSPSI